MLPAPSAATRPTPPRRRPSARPCRPAVGRVPDDRRDGPGRVDDVVRHVGDRRALRGLHEQQVREAADVDAVQRAHAVEPSARPYDRRGRSPRRRPPARTGCRPRSRSRMMRQSKLVLPASHDHQPHRPGDALADHVHQVGVRVVEGLQVLVVEAGRFRGSRTQAFSRVAVTGSRTMASARRGSPPSSRSRTPRRRRASPPGSATPAAARRSRARIQPAIFGPAVLHQVLVGGAARPGWR